MYRSTKQIAKKIDQLALLKARIHRLADQADMLAQAVRSAGGGESKKWIAMLVKMPRRVQVIRPHKQLRLYAK